eukprot:2983911-Rhodomonas_salina.1
MTHCDLVFAYAELSKFVQCPGPVHLKAALAEHVLQYLWDVRGLDNLQLSRSKSAESAHGLGGLRLCVGPLHEEIGDRDCVTLRSAEAEYVAASMAGQEVVYLLAILLGLGYEQTNVTEVWGDNAVCIQISKNPVNSKFTLHIDVRRYYVRDLVQEGTMAL